MVLLDKLTDYFCDHAAVLNEDEHALQTEVKMVQEKYGRRFRVKGFTDYNQLFLALHVAKAKRRPFSLAFFKGSGVNTAELVVKKSEPSIQTYKYKDTQNLKTILPALR